MLSNNENSRQAQVTKKKDNQMFAGDIQNIDFPTSIKDSVSYNCHEILDMTFSGSNSEQDTASDTNSKPSLILSELDESPTNSNLLFVMDINLGRGKSDTLEVYDVEDQTYCIKTFCEKNRLRFKDVEPKLRQQIQNQIQIFKQKDNLKKNSKPNVSEKKYNKDSFTDEIKRRDQSKGKKLEEMKVNENVLDLKLFCSRNSKSPSINNSQKVEHLLKKELSKPNKPIVSQNKNYQNEMNIENNKKPAIKKNNNYSSQAAGLLSPRNQNNSISELGVDLNILKEIYDHLDTDRDNMISGKSMSLQTFSIGLLEALMPILKIVESKQYGVSYSDFVGFIIEENLYEVIWRAFVKHGFKKNPLPIDIQAKKISAKKVSFSGNEKKKLNKSTADYDEKNSYSKLNYTQTDIDHEESIRFNDERMTSGKSTGALKTFLQLSAKGMGESNKKQI